MLAQSYVLTVDDISYLYLPTVNEVSFMDYPIRSLRKLALKPG